jgi:outer membrane receptor protein involved in Fe transport
MLQTGYVNEASGNFGLAEEKGVDVNLGYTAHIGKGALNLDLTGTYVNSQISQNPFFTYDCAGYFGNTCGDPLPKWRHMFRATWDGGNYSVSFAWRYLGTVTVDQANPAPSLYTPSALAGWQAYGSYQYSAYNWFDLAFTWKPSHTIQWMLGVNNIADKEPPMGIGFSGNDYGPGFHGSYDPYGRYIHSSLTFTF